MKLNVMTFSSHCHHIEFDDIQCHVSFNMQSNDGDFQNKLK